MIEKLLLYSTQLNSTQIQRKEAEGAYINPRSLKKKQPILFLNNSNVPQLQVNYSMRN